MRIHITLSILVIALLSGCSTTQPTEDPLKNTKHLIKKGHGDLYNNGAFTVPNTQISLIPPGPSAVEFAKELAGIRARESMQQSLKNARDAVYLVADGTQKSFSLASNLHDKSNQAARYIRDYSRTESQLLVYRAYPHTKEIIGQTWQQAEHVEKVLKTGVTQIISGSEEAGKSVNKLTQFTKGSLQKSLGAAKEISNFTTDIAKEGLIYSRNTFIQGYAALPSALSNRVEAVSQSASLDDFTENFKASLAYRERRSDVYGDLAISAASNYASGVGNSFSNATEAFDEMDQTGFSLAALKATRWVLQGLFWDGLIKPIGKAAVGTAGYLTVNTVTFPVMLVARQAEPVVEVAVEVTWNSAGAVYDVVAPSAMAATASLFSVTGMAVGQTAAALTVAGGATLESGTYLIKGSATVIETSGKIAGTTLNYIGVPLATAGIKVTGTAAGVVVGGVDAIAGSALFVAGETSALATQATGNIAAGTTLTVGTIASTAAGVGLGVYELAKAVVVPAGYTLGGGIVLGYGSTSQIAAHSILAVSDAAYLVLSLEGARWVLYAVKGDVDSGDKLTPGTMLNLGKMQSAGETFYQLPISDKEMEDVLNTLPEDLPQIKHSSESEAEASVKPVDLDEMKGCNSKKRPK